MTADTRSNIAAVIFLSAVAAAGLWVGETERRMILDFLPQDDRPPHADGLRSDCAVAFSPLNGPRICQVIRHIDGNYRAEGY